MATAGAKAAGARARRRQARHEGFLRHAGFRWALVAATLSGACAALYWWHDPDPRPNGGTWLGYGLGNLGALLILWLTALGLRKRVITSGAWSLKAWTSAHVYFGLSLLVVGTLHTGFQLGWNVHTLAYALMVLVVASGLFGVWAYAALPRALSDNRGEWTEAQMLDRLRALDRHIHDAAQPLGPADALLVRRSLEEDAFALPLWRRLVGAARPGRTGEARRSAGDPALAELLDRKLEMTGRIHRHLHLRALLEVWLYVHVPATIALLAALATHIVSVFFYW